MERNLRSGYFTRAQVSDDLGPDFRVCHLPQITNSTHRVWDVINQRLQFFIVIEQG